MLRKLYWRTAEALKRFQKKRAVLQRAKQNWTYLSAGQHYFGGWSTEPSELEEHHIDGLEKYFDAYENGPGIWKWRHYFEIYERHFSKFVGKKPHILEIGIYSGGSLTMWKDYFGPGAMIYGVDIEPACLEYESDQVQIFIGDQSDRNFWRNLLEKVPKLDVVIDDGSHEPAHQIATFEELLPHLGAGGVYACEDISGSPNGFNAYLQALTDKMNIAQWTTDMMGWSPTALQRSIHSVHFYPGMALVEKRSTTDEFRSEKHGTQWQPFSVAGPRRAIS